MDNEGKSKSWWYTLPGVITSLAATITALAGLVAAITQTGWFRPQTPPNITTTSTQAAPPTTTTPVAPAQPPSSTSSAKASYSVELPSMRDYKLGEATFTLLKAEVSPQTTEKNTLQIRLRMMNHGRFDANFWDNSFRLIVDGILMAPESNLNELVPGQSAKEGEVLFVIPYGTTGGKLKITYGDSTEIPLALAPPR